MAPFHAQVLDEPVACVAQCFRQAQARVGVIDDEPQDVTAEPVLPQGDLNDVVRRVHVDGRRAVATNVGVLIGAQVDHWFFSLTFEDEREG